MATIYARLIDEFKFKYHTVFPARFDKQDEDGQVFDEIELFIVLGINRFLTQNSIDFINDGFQLEHQILNQETMDSG